MTNQSARITRLFIGNKDFSSCLISFQGSDNHLDGSGLISFTGQIVLGKALDFDESLDDRKNSRFCRGTPIILQITDTTGTLRRHPRGALRILSAAYDVEKQQLTLEVGDKIALLSFREPTDPDKAENKSLEGKSAAQVLTSLLGEAGITAYAGAMPSANYHHPLDLSGSYLSSAGRLLYANNMFGWIDSSEIFQIEAANITASPSVINLVVAENALWYRRLNGSESPCEVIKAVGTETIVRPTPEEIKDVSEEYGLASTVNKQYGDSIIVISKTITTQVWYKNEQKLEKTIEVYKPFGLVIPEIWWNKTPTGFILSNLLVLINSETTIETSYFEQKGEGKLKTKKTKIYQPRGTYLAEFKQAKPTYYLGDGTLLNLVKQIEETYEYDIKDRLKKIITTTKELEINILNGTDEDWKSWIFPPEARIVSELKSQEYKELNKDNWNYKSFTHQSLVRVNPELVKFQADSKIISNKTNLIYAKGENRTSNSGQEIPPAAERCPTEFNYEENNIEEKALFSNACTSPFKQRERTFSVDLLSSRVEPSLRPGEVLIYATTGGRSAAAQQLLAIAHREGRLLQGRCKGQELAMPMLDSIFNYSPLCTIRAQEPDGTIQNYLADGASWVVSQMKALVSFDGIWVGTSLTPANPEIVVAPYNEPKINYCGLGLGIDFLAYPYLLTSITATIHLGIGMGLQMLQGSQVPLGCGFSLKIDGQFQNSLSWNNFSWETVTPSLWNTLN